MRQELVAYIGGLPVALRKPEDPHTNIEVSDKELDAMEVSEESQSEQMMMFWIAGEACQGDTGQGEGREH